MTILAKKPFVFVPDPATNRVCLAPGEASRHGFYYYTDPLHCHIAWGSLEVFGAAIVILVIWRVITLIT